MTIPTTIPTTIPMTSPTTIPMTTPMTTWEVAVPEFRLFAVDLYAHIHKGIRAELFSLVATAGAVDPSDLADRLAVADHVAATHHLLESHAHHEDGTIQPVLERELPELAERIGTDHVALDRLFARIVDLAAGTEAETGDARRHAHQLYLALGRFTADYLVHIDIEERVLQPALADLVGPQVMAEMEAEIIGSIPPDEMMRSLAIMLPAMNVDDRVGLLSGMREGAPPEAFGAVLDLAGSVLRATDVRQLHDRMGVR